MPIGVKITGIDKISKLSTDFGKMEKRTNQAIRRFIRDYGQQMLVEMQDLSPEKTGTFKSAFKLTQGQNDRVITSVTIRNRSIQAQAIDTGSTPGESPWPVPTVGKARERGKDGKLRKKPSGRTVYSKGKIWSTQAVGGITDRMQLIRPKQIVMMCRNLNNVIASTIFGAI